MKIGTLYKVKQYFWLLFPTKEVALPPPPPRPGPITAADVARYSKYYNCEVNYFSPDSIIVFLEEDGEFKKVLTSEGKIGWTWFIESYNNYFEEMKA